VWRGAHLGEGRVVGDAIECYLHHWCYTGDGDCIHIPGEHDIPATPRVFSYPTVERYGVIWALNSETPSYEQPDPPSITAMSPDELGYPRGDASATAFEIAKDAWEADDEVRQMIRGQHYEALPSAHFRSRHLTSADTWLKIFLERVRNWPRSNHAADHQRRSSTELDELAAVRQDARQALTLTLEGLVLG
jgi:hypothetical protein